MSDLAVPTWIQADGGPLFAWLHRSADGQARGTIVICPPLARELDASHATLRILAERLAIVGFAALRFDYFGTGDSAGDELDAHLVERWRASIRAAVGFVREAGEHHVTLVGLRIGATLAAVVASDLPLEAIVLWDPCAQGRSFVREQYMLHKLALRAVNSDQSQEGWTEISGGRLSPETTEQLRALELPGTHERRTTTPTLLVTRTGEPLSPLVAELIACEGVTHLEAAGQPEMLATAPSEAVIPLGTIDAIVSYVSDVMPVETHELTPALQAQAVLCAGESGRAVVERFVRVGPKELFGIVTDAEGDVNVTVVFLNASLENHLGPSRLWVGLSRQWALHGVRTLRFDTTGLGDSPLVPVPPLYTDSLVDDAVSAAESLSPAHTREVAFVGFCSGGWVASMAGARLRTREATSINQIYWKPEGNPPEAPPDESIYDSFAFLECIAAAGLQMTLIFSQADYELFLTTGGRPAAELRAETEDGGPSADVAVIRIDALDHDGLADSGRRLLAAQLTSTVLPATTEASISQAGNP